MPSNIMHPHLNTLPPCPSALFPHSFHTYFIYLNYLKYLYCYNKCTKRTLDKQTEFFIFHFSPFIPGAEARATPTTIPTTTTTTTTQKFYKYIYEYIQSTYKQQQQQTRCDNTLIKYMYILICI